VGIVGAAAEGYFYSKLSEDGSKTLDDQITHYESRLSKLVAELRALPTGALANPAVAGEVVTHLTTRNAHLRSAFAQSVKGIAQGAQKFFGNQENLMGLLGLDELSPGERFRKHFATHIGPGSALASTGLPGPVLERIAFFLTKEILGSSSNEFVAPMVAMLQELENIAPKLARDSHNKALLQSVAPEARVAKLSTLEWRTEAATADLILPDCVALGLMADGMWCPLMLADADEVKAVMIPLHARALLIGRTADAPSIDTSAFNAVAAECSQNYFLSRSRSDALTALMPMVGRRALTVVEDAVRGGVFEAFPVPQPSMPIRLEQPEQRESGSLQEAGLPELPRQIAITFRGDFDDALRERLVEATGQIVAEAAWTIPLNRLDGITFADDYREGLRTLDRGFPTSKPLESYETETGSGIAQAPTVLRDGTIKGHVVMDGALARCIAGDDAVYRPIAMHALVNQLAIIGCTEIFDDTLPGVLLKPFKDALDGYLQSCVWPGWHAYFSALASAAFNPAHGKLEAEILTNGLQDAQTGIPAARLAYRQHADLGHLLQEVLPRVAFILEHAGALLGHSDGLGSTPFEDNSELAVLLNKVGLRSWLANYHRQLMQLWDRRCEWASFDEFLALNPNAERLLWQYGIFVWRSEEGKCRVQVPLAIDAVELMMHVAGASANSREPRPRRAD
jgi:hypothetical protein